MLSSNRKNNHKLRAVGRCCSKFITCKNGHEGSTVLAFIIILSFILPMAGFILYQLGYYVIIVGSYGYNETTGCYPDELELLQTIMAKNNETFDLSTHDPESCDFINKPCQNKYDCPTSYVFGCRDGLCTSNLDGRMISGFSGEYIIVVVIILIRILLGVIPIVFLVLICWIIIDVCCKQKESLMNELRSVEVEDKIA